MSSSPSPVQNYKRKASKDDSTIRGGGVTMMQTKKTKTTGRDRISELPDEILVSILERLGIRSVIRVSSVSRRWKQVCESISKYDLNWSSMFEDKEDLPVSRDTFIAAVNDLINSSTNNKSTTRIRRFQLVYPLGREHTPVIDSCVDFALRRNVKRLHLQLSLRFEPYSDFREPEDEKYILRPGILSEARKLTTLRLSCCILGQGLFHKLGSLKTLQLRLVTLAESDVQGILSCCHNLECLALIECIVPDKLCFSTSSLRLKHLALEHCRQLKEMKFSISLDSVLYYGDGAVKFTFCGDLNFTSILIKAPDEGGTGSHASLFQPLLQSCFQVAEELSVHLPTDWVHRLPKFTSVKNVKSLYIFSHKDIDFDISKISKILQTFPRLEFLSLTAKGFEGQTTDDDGSVNQGMIHHTSLIEIQLYGFTRLWEQIEFVKFLLGCAVEHRKLVLEPRILSIGDYNWVAEYDDDTWTDDEQQKIRNLLLRDFPKTKIFFTPRANFPYL